MFGFFEKKQADSSEKKLGVGEPIISALLLEGESFPFDIFSKQLTRTKLADKSASCIHPADGGVFCFDIGDELVAMALMPAPYPASDIDGPIATSWMWPPHPPIENVKQHRSHLLITMMGETDNPIRRRLLSTAITALAAKQPDVMAVYWPESTLVAVPPVFVEMAKAFNTPEAPPLYL